VELGYVRGSAIEIYRELNIPTPVLRHWPREFNTYGDNSFPGKGIN